MYMKETIVKCEAGLHNKQATYFIQRANDFKATIWLEAENRRVNAKSLLGVLSMGISQDMAINLIAEGSDEVEAVDELSKLLLKDIY